MLMPAMTDAAGMAMTIQTSLYLYQGRICAFIRVFYMFSRRGAKFLKLKIFFSRKGAKDAKVFIGLMLALSYEAINCSGYAMFH